MKCPKCKGKKIIYTPNIRTYLKNGKPVKRDIGVWDVCKCIDKKN